MIKDVEVLDIKQMRANGMYIADIALTTGYSEPTIRKWLRHEGPIRRKRGKRRPSKLDPHKDYIMGRMADGVFNCEVLQIELKARGYTGGKTILKDFVAPFRKQFKVQAVKRFETGPGEQGQMDWGYLGTFEIDGRLRKVYAFSLVLSYSRYRVVCLTTSMDLETVLLGHQKCFEALGGAPEEIVYDNMKTVTTGRDMEFKPIWQQRFADFALYYEFKPRACSPGKPRSKGKIERSIGYLKDNFCPGRRFSDLTDLNQQLQAWLDNVANTKIHGTTFERPVDRLPHETLKPLPQRPFVTHLRFARRVSIDCFVSYNGVLYSVPWHLAGGEVWVEEVTGGQLRFWWHGQEAACLVQPRYDGLKKAMFARIKRVSAYEYLQRRTGGTGKSSSEC